MTRTYTTTEYTYNTFGELFMEITYDYESKYEPEIYKEEDKTVVSIYKTTITSEGEVHRKGNRIGTFDPALFWKVEMMVKLLLDDPTVKVLYGG